MFKVKVGKTAIHKKTGNIYQVISTDVIDCTNARDGTKMVLYTREGLYFVREYKEFMEKFDVK